MARSANISDLPVPWQRQHLDKCQHSLDQVTKDLIGLQSSYDRCPSLALATRMSRFNNAELKEALSVGQLVLMSAMRGSKFVLHASYAAPAIAAFSSLAEKLTWQGLLSMGATRKDADQAMSAVYDLLKSKTLPVTSRQVKTEVGHKGAEGALFILAARGEVMRGGRRGTYMLRSTWLPDMPDPPSENDAIEQFVHAYLRAYGPAMEDDVVWWMGLNRSSITKALNNVALLRNDSAWVAYDQPSDSLPPPRSLRLLPALDPLTMAWRNRSRIVDEADSKLIYHAQGLSLPAIVWEGRVVGRWDMQGNIRTNSRFKGSESEVKEEIKKLSRVLKK